MANFTKMRSKILTNQAKLDLWRALGSFFVPSVSQERPWGVHGGLSWLVFGPLGVPNAQSWDTFGGHLNCYLSLGAASRICDAFCTEEWSETWVRMWLKHCKYWCFQTFQLFDRFLIFCRFGTTFERHFGRFWWPLGAIWLPAGLRPATREVVNITAGDGLGQGGLVIGKVGGKRVVFGARSSRGTVTNKTVTGRQ